MGSRRALYHAFIAEQANLRVALDIDGFVLPSAAKAMEGRQLSVQGPPSSDFGAASEEGEIGFVAALGVDVHAVADALVEVQFDHAAGLVNASQRGFGGGQVGGVLRAFNAEQVAQRDGVGGVRLDARGQCAGVFVGVGAAGVFVGDGLGGDGRGAVHAGDFGVNIGVVVGYRRGIGGDQAEGGGLGQDGGFELVMTDEEIARAGFEQEGTERTAIFFSLSVSSVAPVEFLLRVFIALLLEE